MDKIISLPLLFVGLYLLSSVVVKKNRPYWSMTKIKTGALSNIGGGLFFAYGACLILFAALPFQSLIGALVLGVGPMVFFFYLGYKGYKIDRKNNETQISQNST